MKKEKRDKEKKELNKSVQKEPKKVTNITKIWVTIITIFLLVILISFLGIVFKEKKVLKEKTDLANEIETRLSESILEYQDKIEYGTTWEYQDFLNNLVDKNKFKDTKITLQVNNTLLTESSKYKFMEVGDIKVKINLFEEYKYKLFKEQKETVEVLKEITLTVQDTNFPLIEGFKDQSITVGEELALKNGIKATDVVDGELEFEISGDFDNNKAGLYEITITSIDKNKNKKEEKFKVEVKEKIVVNNENVNQNNNWQSNSSNNSNNNNNNNNTSSPKTDASSKEGRLYLARLEAQKVVGNIIKPNMSTMEKAVAITKYIYDTVDVQSNQSLEAYKTNYGNEAYAALVMKIAACSGRCKAVMLLCEAAGLSCEHINKDTWQHQWNKILIDGKWLVFDSQAPIYGEEKHFLE